ncbi:hypothetical protein ZIOFF_006420 [Zingiber officinale]|uniref:C2H2-type domain-containing protein n=1 Tax=Zingiber officinale TaxID=94328 RepID=A0A8J5M2V1_ZINOF|nr:hypothetical protein ZIOFF_006420 [Zingiber officinale]
MERKGKEPWMEVVCSNPLMVGGGFSIWPPRSYFCSFCKREFKSAQALGGHMNVHRRDRARLRQPQRLPLPLFDPDLPKPNDLINLLPTPPGPAPAAKEMMIPINVSPLVHFSTAADELRKAVDVTVKELLVEEGESGGTMLPKGREVVRLELEIGIFGGRAVHEKEEEEEEEDLDLELRLGFV